MQQNGNECRSGYPLMMKSEGKKRRRLLSRTSQNSQRNLFMEVVFLLQIFSSWFILEYPNLKSGVEPAYWYQNRLFYGCDTLLAFNKLLLGLTLKQNTPCLLLTLKPQSLWNNLTKYKAQNYNSLSLPPPNSGSKLEAIILVNGHIRHIYSVTPQKYKWIHRCLRLYMLMSQPKKSTSPLSKFFWSVIKQSGFPV